MDLGNDGVYEGFRSIIESLTHERVMWPGHQAMSHFMSGIFSPSRATLQLKHFVCLQLGEVLYRRIPLVAHGACRSDVGTSYHVLRIRN